MSKFGLWLESAVLDDFEKFYNNNRGLLRERSHVIWVVGDPLTTKERIYHVHSSMARFKEMKKQRKQMKSNLRKYPLFDNMEHLYYVSIEQILETLKFCQPNDLDSEQSRAAKIITEIAERIEQILQYYGEYMLILTQSRFASTAGDRERIAIAVKAMSDAVDAAHSDI